MTIPFHNLKSQRKIKIKDLFLNTLNIFETNFKVCELSFSGLWKETAKQFLMGSVFGNFLHRSE